MCWILVGKSGADISVVEVAKLRIRTPAFAAPTPKYRGAHADDGGTFLDCDYEIAAHPHGELREWHPELRLQTIPQLSKGDEKWAGGFCFHSKRRDCHKSLDLQAIESQQLIHVTA